jgi:hypothetical protein
MISIEASSFLRAQQKDCRFIFSSRTISARPLTDPLAALSTPPKTVNYWSSQSSGFLLPWRQVIARKGFAFYAYRL